MSIFLRKEIKTMCERVSVITAAAELGCAPQAVREHMKCGIWDLGEALPPNKEEGRRKWQYHIYRKKLDKHLGKGGTH